MQPALPRHSSLRSVAAASLLAFSVAGCTFTPQPDQPSPTVSSPAAAPTTAVPPPHGKPVFPLRDVQIAAVGDMNGVRTYAADSASGRNAAAITRLVQNNEIDAFLGIGDFQYDAAYCED